MLPIDLCRYWSVVAIPMADTLKSSCGTVFVFCHQSQYVMSSLTRSQPWHKHPSTQRLTSMGVVALIDKLKAMLVNMVAIEEAKRAVLHVALMSFSHLDALCSPSSSFPPHVTPSLRGGVLPAWDEVNLR
jgi:hypothetical protein